MTKQEFILKYEIWLSYTGRDELKKQMEYDLESVIKSFTQCSVIGRREQLVCPNCEGLNIELDYGLGELYCHDCEKNVGS